MTLGKGNITGAGATVITKDCVAALQPFSVAVSVMVPEISPEVVFVPVKEGVELFPLPPRPMAVLLFVQLIVAAGVELNVTAAKVSPTQWLTLATGAITGRGFTVMVKVTGVPVQPLRTGVIVMVDTSAVDPLFTVVNAGMVLLPEAATPVAVELLVQFSVVPAGVPWSVVTGMATPGQNTIFETGEAEGTGFTVMVEVAVFEQPPIVPVTV